MELEIYSPQRVERRRICALVPTTHFACIEMIFAATAFTAGHSGRARKPSAELSLFHRRPLGPAKW